MPGAVMRGGGGGSPAGDDGIRKSLRINLKAKARRRQHRIQMEREAVACFRGNCCAEKGSKGHRRHRRRTNRASGRGKTTRKASRRTPVDGARTPEPEDGLSSSTLGNSTGQGVLESGGSDSGPTPVDGAPEPSEAGPSSSSLGHSSGWGVEGPFGSVSGSSHLGWFSSTSPFDEGFDKDEVRDRAMAHYRKEIADELKNAGGGGTGPGQGNSGTTEKKVLEGAKVPVRVFSGGVGPGAKNKDSASDRDGGRRRGGGYHNINLENTSDLEYFFDKMKVSKELSDDSDDEDEVGGALGSNLGRRPPQSNIKGDVTTGRGRRVKSTPRKLAILIQKEGKDVYENLTPPSASHQTTPRQGPSASRNDEADIQIIPDFVMRKRK